MSDTSQVPDFPFAPPAGYRWLLARGLAGFTPNSALQPWFLLPRDEAFSVTDRWPKVHEASALHAFARRQDCDDLACFAICDPSSPPTIVVVHGWTPAGYEVVARYASFWDWLKSVVDDIEEWVGDG